MFKSFESTTIMNAKFIKNRIKTTFSTELDLHDMNLHVSDMPAVVEEVKKHPHITAINLSNNQIGDDGAEILSELKNLVKLNLSCNYITPGGAKHLSKLKNLVELNVSSNEIGSEGAEAISNLKNLVVLNLANNSVGDSGAVAISTLPNLLSLDVSANRITRIGFKDLAEKTQIISAKFERNENSSQNDPREFASFFNRRAGMAGNSEEYIKTSISKAIEALQATTAQITPAPNPAELIKDILVNELGLDDEQQSTARKVAQELARLADSYNMNNAIYNPDSVENFKEGLRTAIKDKIEQHFSDDVTQMASYKLANDAGDDKIKTNENSLLESIAADIFNAAFPVKNKEVQRAI